MKKRLLIIVAGAVGLYLIVLGLVYQMQERLIFFPQKLPKDYHFAFQPAGEELYFTMRDGLQLHGLLFRAKESRGLIFYLHGNAGSMASWGAIADVYTGLGYDLFMLDYRGFGKSDGRISSEAQLHSDVQAVYDSLKGKYKEQQTIVLGYSIGTGPAARLAANNAPAALVLQAPYYNLRALMQRFYPMIPGFLLRYKLETNRYLPACRMPVLLIHGDVDEVISYQSSLELKALLKPGDSLVILRGQAHNGMSDNLQYRAALRAFLNTALPD